MASPEIASARAAAIVPDAASPSREAVEPGAASALAEHSRFVQRIRRRYPAELSKLPAGVPSRETIVALIDELQRNGRDLASAMRVARQLTLERLAVLDVEGGAPLADVTQAMTELAEATLELALARARADRRPRRRAAQPCGREHRLLVVGMGKLGAASSTLLGHRPISSTRKTHDRRRPFVQRPRVTSPRSRQPLPLIGEVTEDGSYSASTWRCVPTATPVPRRCRWTRWSTTSWSRAANGSASPG